MSDTRAKGCLVAAVAWCVILAILVVAYRFLVHPYLSNRLKGETSSSSQYRDEILVGTDPFSGYALLRSEALKEQLRPQQIRLTVREDRGDVAARLKALQDGRLHLAAFTVDSLILGSARLGEFPGTIILVLDETQGSDAVVALREAVASLQDLNRPDARLVLTPNSPSEFLARVLVANFNLPQLPERWWVEADGSRAVYNQLRVAAPGERRAYVLWEPYVTKALEQPGVHVLLDSSKLRGYIVDVLVARRQFLRDHPEKVKAVIEAYLRVAYAVNQRPTGWTDLVRSDAQRTGAESLDDAQAQRVAAGIRWRNTLENYVHFGLTQAPAGSGIDHIEDVISRVVDVLVKTRAVTADPLQGQYHTLFYRDLLAELQRAQFHPGKGATATPGADEQLRSDTTLQGLSEAQWQQLQPVGELRVDPIVFLRGSATVSAQSERDLQGLAKRLQSFPHLYLRVVGQTRAEGDPEANRQLAQARAEAVARLLQAQSVSATRIRTEAAPSVTAGGEGQAVGFVVGQVPY